MKHVLLDLETMGKGPTAAITSIGAVVFNLEDGVTSQFYRRVDLQSCVTAGLTMDASTVLWWMEQDDAARSEFQRESVDLMQALGEFREWFPAGAKLWGNGATFDNVIMRSAYDALDMKAPWEYWDDRCLRTLRDLRPDIPRPKPELAHHALSDARAQAEHALAIMRAQVKEAR
jgi:exodeoxyribonuclease VIII